jgi:hypothetical protein
MSRPLKLKVQEPRGLTVFQLPDHGFARAVCGGAPQMFLSLNPVEEIASMYSRSFSVPHRIQSLVLAERHLTVRLFSSQYPQPSLFASEQADSSLLSLDLLTCKPRDLPLSKLTSHLYRLHGKDLEWFNAKNSLVRS